MADIVDVMYRLRDMAAEPIEQLRAAIADAQAVLDKLDRFATDAEEAAELVAASDLHPTHQASIPAKSGLVRATDEAAGE